MQIGGSEPSHSRDTQQHDRDEDRKWSLFSRSILHADLDFVVRLQKAVIASSCDGDDEL